MKRGKPDLLNFAIQTARDAGRVLAEKFGRALQVSSKGDIDLVTEADIAAEQLIVERVRSYHPRHAVLAEEAGDVLAVGGADSEYKWIIDPLDGTTNYAHGYPCFCVSVALEHKGRVVLGVVHDPLRDETFAAERGAGASLNGRPARVEDPRVRRLAGRRLLGSLDQFSDSTDLVSDASWRAALRRLYD